MILFADLFYTVHNPFISTNELYIKEQIANVCIILVYILATNWIFSIKSIDIQIYGVSVLTILPVFVGGIYYVMGICRLK